MHFFDGNKKQSSRVVPAICLASDTLPTHRSEVDGSEEDQLGVGGSSISKALQESLGCKRQKLRECYKKFGDLGDAAEYIASSKGRQALFQTKGPQYNGCLYNAD